MDLNADYDVTCYTGATRKQSELKAAFERVANKQHWKLPIHFAEIRSPLVPMPQAERDLLTDAIVHFTGSVPTFKQNHIWFVVEAEGYFRTIGA